MFGGGLLGLAAKKPIGKNKGFVFIPNTIVLSVDRVKACPEFQQLIQDNQDIFGNMTYENYEPEMLLIALFIFYHQLKGNASFWKPYIDVMY